MNETINQLPIGSAPAGTEKIPAWQGGSTVSLTAAQIAAVGSVLQVARVPVTSAQLLACHATPIAIVAAPGAGKLVIPLQVWAYATSGTTPYTNQSSPGITIGDQMLALGRTAFSSIPLAFETNNSVQANDSLSVFENMPAVFTDSQAWAGGNLAGIIGVLYQVITI